MMAFLRNSYDHRSHKNGYRSRRLMSRNLLLMVAVLILNWSLVGCRDSSEFNGDLRDGEVPSQPDLALSNEETVESLPLESREPSTIHQQTNLRFTDRTLESGVQFTHQANRTQQRWMPEIIGSGVLIADFNRDGAPDLILINGGHVESQSRSKDCENRMFLNDGKGQFTDVTEVWGLTSAGYGMGGTAGDFDNDGWPDVFLTTWGGGNTLLQNTGAGFVDVTESSGIEVDSAWATSVAFFDADNDGWLDLYIVRYVDYDPATAIPSFFRSTHVYSTPVMLPGVSDQLWINQRNGTFFNGPDLVDSTNSEFESNWKGLAVGTCDLNQDGLPEIYVANDTTRNLLFLNKGENAFEEIGRLNGVAYGDTGKEQAGMGVDFADVDGDGQWDIVCTNFQEEPANLFLQKNNLLFLDRTDSRGVGISSRGRLQWGCKFLDADNDGDDDLIIVNGHVYDQIETLVAGVTFGQPNSLLENDGSGRFSDVSYHAGNAFRDSQVSRGLAIGDLDNDGRIDFVVNNNDGTAQIAFNVSENTGNFVSLWLEGTHSNRSAIGARVVARMGDRKVMREIFGGTSFLSSSDMRVHIGLGAASQVDEVEVFWPSGGRQLLTDLNANQFYYLREGNMVKPYVPGKEILLPEPDEAKR